MSVEHPGPFSFGAKQYDAKSNITDDSTIISKVLTAQRVNEWVEHFKKVYKWYMKDENAEYEPATIYYTSEAQPPGSNKGQRGLLVESGDIITARWFQNCLRAMNAVGKGYSEAFIENIKGGADGTIITASLIDKLSFSGLV